jgi:histone H4
MVTRSASLREGARYKRENRDMAISDYEGCRMQGCRCHRRGYDTMGLLSSLQMVTRHRKRCVPNWGPERISKSAIRRMARKGGVKRMSSIMFEESRAILYVYVKCITEKAIEYALNQNRRTVLAKDVCQALKLLSTDRLNAFLSL